ncbi:MAG: BatA domain-containing protein [Bacteroidota bacterium]
MTFLNPLLLFGLAAAAIPIIIHLFNFRRPRKVDFSTLVFLKELQRSTMQRVRIKQWLLLALRTLAIACLVVAFARPTVTGNLAQIGGRAPTSVALLVDNSLSMTLRDAQGAYLEQAREIARGLIDQVEPGDEILLLTTDATATGRADVYRSRSAALSAIDAVEPARTALSSAEALARAAEALEGATHLSQELYLVTDLQASTWTDSTLDVLSAEVPVAVVPVGAQASPNIAVTGVDVQSRIVEVGQPVDITATLANYGAADVEGYVVSLFLGDDRVAQATATIPAEGETTVAFTATPQEVGWLQGVVEAEADVLEEDNARYFALNVPERRRILLVQGAGQSTRFLELALSEQLASGRVAFAYETIGEGALAAAALGQYDAVVLVGVRDLSSGEVASVARYVEEGGGMLMLPSEAARAEDYDALFAALGGGTFGGFSGQLGQGEVAASFDEVDQEHPLFDGVFEASTPGTPGRVERVEVSLSMNYVAQSGSEQTLVQLSNGFPFLQEVRMGNGAAFIMAVALDPQWSDLPLRGLFVPLVYRMLYYLSAGESVQGDALIVGQDGDVRLAGLPETVTVRLVGPQGADYALEPRRLFGATRVQVGADLDVPGVYTLEADGEVLRRIGVNLDGRESDLRTLAPAQAVQVLEQQGARVRVLDVDGGREGVADLLLAERSGLELWNVFLLLALAFLVAEMAVAQRWRPEAVPG